MNDRHFARGIIVSILLAAGTLAVLSGCPREEKGPVDLFGLGDVPEVNGKYVDPWASKYSADCNRPRVIPVPKKKGRSEPLPKEFE